jgi:hypothetical protein
MYFELAPYGNPVLACKVGAFQVNVLNRFPVLKHEKIHHD